MAAAVKVSSERVKGTVRWFNATKGSGFVIPDYGNELIYFHQPSLKSDGVRILNVDDSVEFEVRVDKYGSSKAFDITARGGGVLTGDSHGDVLTGCGGGPCYDGDGALGYSGGSSYGVDGGRGFYSCGEEVVALPVLSEGTALQMFDVMLPSVVVWDEQTGHDVSCRGDLLEQLAKGGEFMDEIPTLDVVWDEELPNSHDSHVSSLEWLALGKEHFVDEEEKLIAKPDFSSELPHVNGITVLSNLGIDYMDGVFHEMLPEIGIWDEEVPSKVVEHDSLLQQLAMGAGMSSDVVWDEVFTHELKLSLFLEHDGDDADHMSEGAQHSKTVANEMFTEEEELHKVVLYSRAQAYEGSCTKAKLAQGNDNATLISLLPTVDVTAQFSNRISSWCLDGFSPWSKLTDKASRLVFLAYAYLMDMVFRRLYFFFKQWDPGISENTRGCTTELLVPVLQMVPTINLTESLPYLKLSFSDISRILTQKMLQSESEIVEMLLCWETISCSSDKKMMSQVHVVTQFVFPVSIVLLLWLKASPCQTESINHDRAYCHIKIWDAGILRRIFMQFQIMGSVATGRYEISSSVLFIQSLVILLMPLLHVLNHMHPKTQSAYLHNFIPIVSALQLDPYMRRHWDPGRLNDVVQDSLLAQFLQKEVQTQNEQRVVCSAEHTVAWGQATFCWGGNVTPGLWAEFNGPLASRSKPMAQLRKQHELYKGSRRSIREAIRIFRNENWVHPFLRRLPHGGEIPVSSSSVSLVGDALSRAHVPAVARRRPRVVTVERHGAPGRTRAALGSQRQDAGEQARRLARGRQRQLDA